MGWQGRTRVARRPIGFALWALKESVDGWPMAIIILKTFGGQPESDIRGDPVSCFTARQGIHVIGPRYPPTEVRMVQCGPASSVANPHVCPGPFLGQLSGGNWIARVVFRRLRPWRVPPGGASGSGSAPDFGKYPDHPSGGGV